MKKLNEEVLRRLIMETIDEQAGKLNEGKKKKKLKEADPVEEPLRNPEQDVAHGMEAEPQPQDFGMAPQFTDDQIKHAHDALDKAFEFAKSGNPMLKGSSEDMLKQIMKMFKGDGQE